MIQELDTKMHACSELLRDLAAVKEADLPECEEFERLVAQLYKAQRKRKRRRNGTQRKSNDRTTLKAAAAVRAEGRGEEVPYAYDAANRDRPLQHRSRRCYVCNQPFREFHAFYHMLCPTCGDESFAKRDQSADLRGRRALVTGGRIKIGYATALKLLRAGATTHVTTRYSADAAVRFSEEPDFDEWSERLHIHRVDFRDLRGLVRFIKDFAAELPSLNIIINNAAQSVRRSDEYHQRLQSFEAAGALTKVQTALLGRCSRADNALSVPSVAMAENALTSQALLRDDNDLADPRELNTWNMRLSDVEPLEILEVLLVNSNAPALIVSGLRSLLCQSSHEDRYIINVSGADGTFDLTKSGLHPHVNMSKAAANMLTRSIAGEYLRDGICVNSVDTGWITHEGGYSNRKLRSEQGFVPPFDIVDGAARILDPIFRSVSSTSETGDVESGRLYRNFNPSPW